VINDKQQLLAVQNYYSTLRTAIWKDLSQFEDATAKLISTITATKKTPDHYYQLLIEQYHTLLTVLDLLFMNQMTRKFLKKKSQEPLCLLFNRPFL
jgi:hypothetical protein